MIEGTAAEVWEPHELRAARDLPLRPWAPGAREHYVRIVPDAVSGRQIR